MISVIVPIYNVKQYILKCLDSICNQTFHGEIECILVDDCGNDDSIKIAKEYIKEYQGGIHFRIIHHEKNKGVSEARNTGLCEANGDWFFFVDPDDYIVYDCIEQFVKCVEKNPQVDMIVANTASSMSYVGFDSLPYFSNDKKWIANAICSKNIFLPTVWNKLYSRRLLNRYNSRFDDIKVHEDEIWLFGLAMYVQSIGIVHNKTYFYNERVSGLTKSSKSSCEISMNYVKMWSYEVNKLYRGVDTYFCTVIINDICDNFCHVIPEHRKYVRKKLLTLMKYCNCMQTLTLIFMLPLIKLKLINSFFLKN